jgi:hypothetical protein
MSQSSLTADEDPIRTSGPPVADEVAPTPYFTSNFTRSISDEAIATPVERFATAPSPLSMVGLKPRAMVNKRSVEKGLMERRCHE